MSYRKHIQQNSLKSKGELTPLIQQKILTLNTLHQQVEWSGILFYSKKEDDIILEDLLLMDVGSATYTEYDASEIKVIKYLEKIGFIDKGWAMGHIHSHNNMAVFFSGTDMTELYDNSPNHKEYLSVIVNNKLEVCGKMCIAQNAKFKTFDQNDTMLSEEDGYVFNITDLDVTFSDNGPIKEVLRNIASLKKKKLSKVPVHSGRRIEITTPGQRQNIPMGAPEFDFEEDTKGFSSFDDNDDDPIKTKKVEKFLSAWLVGDFERELNVPAAIHEAAGQFIADPKKFEDGLEATYYMYRANVFGNSSLHDVQLSQDILAVAEDNLEPYTDQWAEFCQVIIKELA